MGSNDTIKESLHYAARVRDIALQEINCESSVNNRHDGLENSYNNINDDGQMIIGKQDNNFFYNKAKNNDNDNENVQNEKETSTSNIGPTEEPIGYPTLQNYISKFPDSNSRNMQTFENNENVNQVFDKDEQIRIKEKYQFKHQQADRLHESGKVQFIDISGVLFLILILFAFFISYNYVTFAFKGVILFFIGK